MKLQSIGKDKAVKLAQSGWWKGRSARDIAKFQLLTRELTMPFDVFHSALQEALGRPVWTHELGLNWEGLVLELLGEKDRPTMQEIFELIPEDKRILLIT